MSKFEIRKATLKQARARIAIEGPSGSGKTMTALIVATIFGGPIVVIDSEGGSSEKYADKFNFDVLRLEDFSPDTYLEAVKYVELQGYNIGIIDSFSHSWAGKGGALQLVDEIANQSFKGNSWAGWSKVTPKVQDLNDAILRSPMHWISCFRTKTEWVIEKNDHTGKNEPKKVGLAAIARDGIEYEYDVTLRLNHIHTGLVSKTRFSDIDGMEFHKPGEEFATMLKNWLESGEENPWQEEHTKDRLIEVARIKYDLTQHDIATALKQADLKFDEDKWDEMLSILENYEKEPAEDTE